MASNHGNLNRDIIGGNLYIKNSEIIDSKRNIKNIKKATIGSMHIKKDLNVNGEITTTKLLIKDPSNPTNVYLFGPSTLETGSLAAYYPNVIPALISISGTNLRHVIQPGAGGFPFDVVYNTDNRHSDGLSTPDYLSDMLGMPLVNGFEINQLPVDNGKLINYAVTGATALGCTWNAFPSPLTFANVAGANGIVDQVDKFLSHLTAANKTIDPNDIFVFASQNINDLGVIGLLGGGIPAAIGASVTGVMTKLQQLYNLGARHIMFQLVGDGATLVNAIPAFIKVDVAAPGTLAALAGLSDAITGAYLGALSSAVAPAGSMSELDLILSTSSAYASILIANPENFGFRASLLSDPDPRVPPAMLPAFPFPTMLDQALAALPNIKLDRKVGFSDDFHHTQTAHKAFAQYLFNFLVPFQLV